MDMFQHINNVSYFKFTQANRLNILDKVGLTDLFANTKVGPTLAHTQCSFKTELNYPGNVIVRSSIQEIKNTSFIIHHELYNDDDILCAEANDVIVVYNYLEQTKQPIPTEVREKLQAI
jgi:acyl-CoA thioester hydrolase